MKKYMLWMALTVFFFCCGFSFQNTETRYIRQDMDAYGTHWEQYTEVYVLGKNETTAYVYYMGIIYELPLDSIASLEEISQELALSGKQIKEMRIVLTVKENTKVYIKPGASQGVIGALRKGQPAIATTKPVGGWIQIYYVGMIGYIQENVAEFYMVQPLLAQEKMPLKDGLRINILGDSISFGDKLKDKSKAYPYVLASKAGAVSLNNYGLCGSSMTGFHLDRFIDRYAAMDRNADLVLVFGGTNDYGVQKGVDMGFFNDISDQTFCGGLNLMMCGLKQMYPDGEIVFATPLRRWGDKRKNAKGYTLQQYVSAIQTLGNFWGIRVIDLYSAPELNFAANPSYLVDGLHPKASGHTLIGNVLYRELFEGTEQ